MKFIGLLFSIYVLGMSSFSEAQEWVPFEGEMPENAFVPTDENRYAGAICRMTGPRQVSPKHLLGSVQEVEGKLVCRGVTYSARRYKPAGGKVLIADPEFEVLIEADVQPAEAQEWVPFEGEMPENAFMPTDENRNAGAICRMTGPRQVSPKHLLGSVQEVEGKLVCRGATYSARAYRPAGGKVLLADPEFDVLIKADVKPAEAATSGDCGSFPMDSDGSVMVATPDDNERWLMSGEYAMNSDGSVTVNKEGEPDNGVTVTPPPCNDDGRSNN